MRVKRAWLAAYREAERVEEARAAAEAAMEIAKPRAAIDMLLGVGDSGGT